MIKDIDGVKFKITNQSDDIQRHIVGGRFYEQKDLDILKEYLQKGWNILDVGTNIGNHTFFFARYFEPKVIYVTEPFKLNRDVLLENVSLNNFNCINTDYINYALGNESGHCSVEFYVPDNPGGAVLKTDDGGEIPLTSGDSLFSDKQIDFIKIDVEGMEKEVIEGLQVTIDINKPLMFIEIRHPNRDWFNRWLKDNNYENK